MNIILLGATGFIGTNLVNELAKNGENEITVVGRNENHFNTLKGMSISNLKLVQSNLTMETNFEKLLEGQDVVYHLISTTVPTTSNQAISEELKANVVLSANMFEACVHQKIKKIVFLSSGGTVYGKESKCPLNEETPTNPITSYGVQKISIEKLLFLYNYMYDIDYRVIRLANPYGPYQRPNGILGAVTTFTYKALCGEEIQVYGDGSVVRDFIYIDDAVRGIQKIVNGTDRHCTFNLGCGYGTSIKQVLDVIRETLNLNLKIKYVKARDVDVPVNYLDIRRYETAYGSLNPIGLEEGIRKTADFMRQFYGL